MFARTAVSALNHILSGENWARERLRGFVGQHVRLLAGPVAVELAIDSEGIFQLRALGSEVVPAVTIELPADLPFRLLNGRDTIFAAARLSGSADFAEALAFVFRNLRWDVEDDLSRLVGDIAARRLVRGGKAVFAWQKAAAANFAANIAEYLSDEKHLVVPARDVRRFVLEVEATRANLENLEKRLARL